MVAASLRTERVIQDPRAQQGTLGFGPAQIEGTVIGRVRNGNLVGSPLVLTEHRRDRGDLR